MCGLYSERKSGQSPKGDFRTLGYLCNIVFDAYLIESWKGTRDPEWIRHVTLSLQKFFLIQTRNITLDPFSFAESVNNEESLFDMLECGYQFLDKHRGIGDPDEYEKELNDALYGWGFTMKDGRISNLPEEGLSNLVNDNPPSGVIKDDAQKIRHAQDLFFKRSATIEDKKSAIRTLGDLLEHERQKFKDEIILGEDEKEIFLLLNNFSLRHHKNSQKDFTEPYLTWSFYNLLNAVKTFLKLIDGKETR